MGLMSVQMKRIAIAKAIIPNPIRNLRLTLKMRIKLLFLVLSFRRIRLGLRIWGFSVEDFEALLRVLPREVPAIVDRVFPVSPSVGALRILELK